MKYTHTLLDRGWILAHIPHQGRMCLLDEVISWNAEHISCLSRSHRDLDHPLRAHGRLGIACGVEYAAQAMAVHGALSAGALGDSLPTGAADAATPAGTPGDSHPTKAADAAAPAGAPGDSHPASAADAAAPAARPAAGFLAALRGVHPYAARLDDLQDDLIVDAIRVAGDQGSALYDFELRAGMQCLLHGRATVVLDTKGRLP